MSLKAINSKIHAMEVKIKIMRKDSREIPASMLHELAILRFKASVAK